MIERKPGEGMALAVAREYAKRTGGVVVRKRDGFILVYRRICDGSNCKRVLVWFRGSPINMSTLKTIRGVLSRMGWDEVWLVRLYREPDFTEDYKDFVTREFYWRELFEEKQDEEQGEL